jgi:recombinational DNA repair protein RecR
MNKETLLKILEERKDQLNIAPELIIDELIKRLNAEATDYISTAVDSETEQRAWDRYLVPHLLPMGIKVFR